MKLFRNYKYYSFQNGVKTIYLVRPKLVFILFVVSVLFISGSLYSYSERYQEGEYLPYKKSSTKKPNKIKDNFGLSSLLSPLPAKKAKGAAISSVTGLPEPQPARTVTTTVFWVGEQSGPDNGYIANYASAWDETWQLHFGGVDSDISRDGYNPTGFTPKENPFYFALPYSDFTNSGKRKSTAKYCPNAATLSSQPYSWCKNSWIKIESHGKIAYAQWQDVGPFETDDVDYVFGTTMPKNNFGARAGLDVSPATRDYLGLADVDKAKWQFVSASSVPQGPWKQTVTTSPGELF